MHPDRNYGNVDEATRLFAEIQSAYEVLADPQERAWYDSHKDAFLGTAPASDGSSEGAYNIRITTAEEVLKVFSKFSPRMEFSDSPSGFFGGLQEQFAQLSLEERAACQWENLDIIDYPSFGSANDDFESVVRPFYSVWTGFSTKKSFAWKDAHRLSEAPDRRVRRLMEKENRRLRDEGIRTFNDAVRSLVAFIKKRDPRWKINAQNEAQRQEALRQSVAAQAARSRAMNNAKMRDHVLPEWAQSGEQVVSEDEESSESEIESFECVACNKNFKSEKQFDAHEKSKKHIKAVKQLTREMRFQDVQLDLDKPTAEPDASDLDLLDDDDLPAEDIESVRTPSPVVEVETITDEAGEPPFVQSQDMTPSELDKDAKVSSLATPDQELDSADSGDDDDYASREAVETRLHPDLSTSQDQDLVTPLNEQLSSVALEEGEAEEQPRTPALGKAKQKKAKKAAREAADQNQSQSGMMCSGCNTSFPSKTKLFAHLQKNPSHAQLKTATKGRRR